MKYFWVGYNRKKVIRAKDQFGVLFHKNGLIKKLFYVICYWWNIAKHWLSIWFKKSSLYNTDNKTQFELWAKLFVKLFTSGPSLQIRKLVLNNQYMILCLCFVMVLPNSYFCSYCIIIDLLTAFSIVSFHYVYVLSTLLIYIILIKM